ncbi:hypothetical protein D9M72_291590 [compost metagenome]
MRRLSPSSAPGQRAWSRPAGSRNMVLSRLCSRQARGWAVNGTRPPRRARPGPGCAPTPAASCRPFPISIMNRTWRLIPDRIRCWPTWSAMPTGSVWCDASSLESVSSFLSPRQMAAGVSVPGPGKAWWRRRSATSSWPREPRPVRLYRRYPGWKALPARLVSRIHRNMKGLSATGIMPWWWPAARSVRWKLRPTWPMAEPVSRRPTVVSAISFPS